MSSLSSGSVNLDHQKNRDGSTTFVMKCGLMVKLDDQGEEVENPVRTLVKTRGSGRYVLREDGDTAMDGDDNYAVPTSAIAVDETDIEDTLLVRECWCGKVLESFLPPDSFSFPNQGGIHNGVSGGIKDVYCPLDTNGDGDQTLQDVRACEVRVIVYADGNLVFGRSYGSRCYSERPIAEFSKTAWPLCFFWWMVLLYMVCATTYGQRVKGYMWRACALGCLRCRRKGSSSQRTHATDRPAEETHDGGESSQASVSTMEDTRVLAEEDYLEGIANRTDGNEEEGDGPRASETDANDDTAIPTASDHTFPPLQTASDITEPTPPSSVIPRDSQAPESSSIGTFSYDDSGDGNDEEEEDPMAIIERDFGSYENYRLLDKDLRYHAGRTNNDFVTWLWYSAVYTEVRRFRSARYRERYLRQQRQRRRQREQRRRRGRRQASGDDNAPSSDSEHASDDNNEDDEDDELHDYGSDFLLNRRLNSVYWYPASDPEGQRWEHLRTRARAQRESALQQTANGCDPNRLQLKTKIFSLADAKNHSFVRNEAELSLEEATDVEESASLRDIVIGEGNDDDGESEDDAASGIDRNSDDCENKIGSVKIRMATDSSTDDVDGDEESKDSAVSDIDRESDDVDDCENDIGNATMWIATDDSNDNSSTNNKISDDGDRNSEANNVNDAETTPDGALAIQCHDITCHPCTNTPREDPPGTLADTVFNSGADPVISTDDDDEIPDNVCSICLCELEEGDVVGDIACGHVFHKDCLKAWLLKNNHCPVCRTPNIASHPFLLTTGAPTIPPLRMGGSAVLLAGAASAVVPPPDARRPHAR